MSGHIRDGIDNQVGPNMFPIEHVQCCNRVLIDSSTGLTALLIRPALKRTPVGGLSLVCKFRMKCVWTRSAVTPLVRTYSQAGEVTLSTPKCPISRGSWHGNISRACFVKQADMLVQEKESL